MTKVGVIGLQVVFSPSTILSDILPIRWQNTNKAIARLDIEIQRKIAQDLFQICFPLKTSNISDSKRQQTTIVDYKRLING